MIVWFGLSTAFAGADHIEVSAEQIRARAEAVEAIGDVRVTSAGETVRADSLRLDLESGVLEAGNVRWSPCTCEREPWGISAERGEGDLAGELNLSGVWLEVCDRKVLPLPGGDWAMAKREPHPMMPTLGFDPQGGRFGAPTWFPIGASSSAELAPQIRWNGPPGLDARVTSASLRVDSEWLFEDQGSRGQTKVTGSNRTPAVNWGIDAGWVSDSRYRPEYGNTFFDRQLLAESNRVHFSSGPGRIEYSAPLEAQGPRTVAGVLSFPAETIVSGSLASRMRAEHTSTDGDVVESIGVSATYTKGFETDLFRMAGEVGGLQTLDSTGAVWGEYGTLVNVGVLHWSEVFHARLISVSGVASELRYTRRSGDVTRQNFAGPFHETRVVNSNGVPLRTRLSAPIGPDGWDPEGEVGVQTDFLHGLVRASLREQAATIGGANDAVHTNIGVIRDKHLTAAYGGGGVSFRSLWHLSWSGAVDLAAVGWVRHGPSLRWGPHCDCVSATASVEWARDLDWPTAFVRVDLRPEG